MTQVSNSLEIDKRTFPEIWATLTENEKDDLSLSIMQSKACKTRQTLWNWGTGRVTPSNGAIKNAISKCVGSVLKIKTHPNVLFPSR